MVYLKVTFFLHLIFHLNGKDKSAFKFNMDLDVLLIYRLVPRAHGLLGYTATFCTTPISRFFEAFFFLSRMHTIWKCFVSGYQLIDMHCIALPVKFDGGLSISFLRKKQLFKIHFNPRQLKSL
jgi:hypothetical protein